MLQVRAAQSSDRRQIAAIILPTIREGETYTLDPDMSEAQALEYWLGPDRETFVAVQKRIIVGPNSFDGATPAGTTRL